MDVSIYELEIDGEYKNVVEDIIKYSTIFFVINILVYLSYPSKSLLNKTFCDVYSFLVIGILAYHLIIKKILVFKVKEETI